VNTAETQPFQVEVFGILKSHGAYAETASFVNANKPFKGIFDFAFHRVRRVFRGINGSDICPPTATNALYCAFRPFFGCAAPKAAGSASNRRYAFRFFH
jgi:hypothetical protein